MIAIFDAEGNAVVSYAYYAHWQEWDSGGDAGDCAARGYVFDEETGLYYLRSRYYNAERCRFVNADSVVSGNLFCYCYNSPIDLLDLSGKSSFLD